MKSGYKCHCWSPSIYIKDLAKTQSSGFPDLDQDPNVVARAHPYFFSRNSFISGVDISLDFMLAARDFLAFYKTTNCSAYEPQRMKTLLCFKISSCDWRSDVQKYSGEQIESSMRVSKATQQSADFFNLANMVFQKYLSSFYSYGVLQLKEVEWAILGLNHLISCLMSFHLSPTTQYKSFPNCFEYWLLS